MFVHDIHPDVSLRFPVYHRHAEQALLFLFFCVVFLIWCIFFKKEKVRKSELQNKENELEDATKISAKNEKCGLFF